MLQGTKSDLEMLGHEENKPIYKTVMKLVGYVLAQSPYCESLENFAEWNQNREESNTLGLLKTVLQAALH